MSKEKTIVRFAVIAIVSILALSCGCKEQETTKDVVVSNDTIQKRDRHITINGRSFQIEEADGETVYEEIEEFAHDTIDVDSFLVDLEKMVSDIESVHIKSLADTIKLVELNDEYGSVLGDAFSINGDSFEELPHSKRVRFLKSFVGVLTELKRLGQECSKVGYSNAVWDDELEEIMTVFQKTLDRELS